MLFLAMGAGLISGMGYLAYAVLFSLVLGVAVLLCAHLDLGVQKNTQQYKTLTITIPEDLDYSDVFDSVLARYATSWELVRVKTTNMGSLFRLTYNLCMKPGSNEKELLDQLRCRNGNLEISVSRQDTTVTEL